MTPRTDNYLIQAAQARARFLTYDQDHLIEKFGLQADSCYLYMTLLAQPYRISRSTGDIQSLRQGVWSDSNTHEEVMPLLDLLCDSRDDRHLSGRFQNLQSFGLQFHRNLLEDRPSPIALKIDRAPEAFCRACEKLGGVPVSGADLGYRVILFDGLPIEIQFWHGDEEFAPRIRYLWDENSLQYLRYETMHYAVALLNTRLEEEM